MNRYIRSTGTRAAVRGLVFVVTAGVLAAAARDVAAQETYRGYPVQRVDFVSAGGDPNTPDLDLRARRSPFRLRAMNDVAFSGMRMAGTFNYFMSNAGPGDYNYDPGYLGYLLHRGGWRHNFFEITFMAGTPRSTWVKYRDVIPSLQNIANEDGYSAAMNGILLSGMQNFAAADGTLGALFSGVASTSDGSCRDHSATLGGQLDAGVTLLAGSNCPETWPSGGWQGSPLITAEGWAEYFNRAGHDFRFDWWAVPEDLHTPGFIGSFQTYGRISDFYAERLADYGSVIPNGSGKPVKEGYPLGLEIDFDAFSFTLPSVANAVFWQAKITNASEKVYGVGIDYDSLYIGFSPQPSNTIQETATYYEPQNGSVRWVNNGVHPGCNGARVVSGVSSCLTSGERGFYWGATQMIILKSPIGDLRNKLFTTPGSPFYDPTHPAAGDTITFNHGHICGYGGCAATTLLTGRDRRRFGMLSSTEVNVLDGRAPASLSATEYWRTFYSKDYPSRTGFNRYVPGDWTYSNRPPGAPVGPDTLYLDTCSGENVPPEVACVVTWSDTLPGGLNNRYGNVQVVGIGPFPLKAGESTGVVISVMGAPDSIGIEDLQKSVIDLYMNFWLSPQPPATAAGVVNLPDGRVHRNEPLAIVATNVTAGDINTAQVTLFLNDGAENWVDPFLIDYYKKLVDATPGTALATLRDLNPWLADSVLARAFNNLEAIYIYKSCNGGTSWTDDQDCAGDEAVDERGNPVGNGWRPAQIITAGADGSLPNIWTDTNVRPGVTYLYSISTLSRGAEWPVLNVDADGDTVVTVVQIAPKLLAPLSASTSDPNVASVYVPISLVAGGERATATFPEDGQVGPARVPYHPISARVAGEPESAATYRVVFGDAFTIRQGPDGVVVEVERVSGTETFTHPNRDIVTIHYAAGDTAVTTTTSGETTTTNLRRLGIVVVRSDGAPLLVSTELTGDAATPGTFIARSDFPNFTLSVDATLGGQFNSTFYVDVAAGDTLSQSAAPSVVWDRNASVRRASAGVASGEYHIEWKDRAYGPQAPVRIDFGSPSATSQAISASLNARQVAQTGEVSQEVVDLVRGVVVQEYSASAFDQSARARAERLSVDDLVAVKLPFTVRNASFDRDVKVVMLKREVRAELDALAQGLAPEGVELRVARANEITLGQGVGTVQSGVTVPGDVWIPGDKLYFIEDAGSGPVVTWGPAAIQCVDPRPSCNPVAGPGSSAYVSPRAGLRQVVRYYVPFTSASEYRLEIKPAVKGADVKLAKGALDDIMVVPNPYIGRSTFEQTTQSTEGRIYFVNMPPEGVLRIYTVSGAFVQEIRWTQDDLVSLDHTTHARPRASGDLAYDLRTREGNDLASGLYLFVVEAGGQKKIGKFVVIQAKAQ